LYLKELVELNKKHDQNYWKLLEKSTGGKDYILGIKDELALHCGKSVIPSVCNALSSNRNNLDLIKFEKEEEKIDNMTFDQFYEIVSRDKSLLIW
jgi:hypothetical protein